MKVFKYSNNAQSNMEDLNTHFQHILVRRRALSEQSHQKITIWLLKMETILDSETPACQAPLVPFFSLLDFGFFGSLSGHGQSHPHGRESLQAPIYSSWIIHRVIYTFTTFK